MTNPNANPANPAKAARQWRNLLSWHKRWYAQQEARSLRMLTAEERSDVRAFDAAFRKNQTRYIATLVTLWVGSAVLAKMAMENLGWVAAFSLSGVILLSMIVALISAWFGPFRFKTGMKSFILLLVVTVSGAMFGGFGANVVKTSAWDQVLAQFVRIAPKILMAGLIAGMVYAVLMVSIVQYRRGQLQRRNQQLEQQAQQERMGRQLADARLKLMQAQVEPHFLFNTLASVQQLAEGKAPEAAQLTAQLITFLRGGLASLREDTATLGCEFRTMEAYLTIMQTRMDDRLQFNLSLPEPLKDMQVPPAMLISLVENAIKHGLEPSLEGGRIDVSADSEGGRLKITVIDTGRGPDLAKSGGGVGLDNIRQRLRVLFSDHAHLVVAKNVPHGFIAVIDLPLQVKNKKTDFASQNSSKGKHV
ncbi:MAG: histidine kinase [Betaproteobacteria bacterium]